MKKGRQWLALAVTAVLLTAVLAACGKRDGGAGSQGADAVTRLYKSFLKGETEAEIRLDGNSDLSLVCVKEEQKDGGIVLTPFFGGRDAVTLQQLTDGIRETKDLNPSGMKVFYAIADTTFGGRALVLRYQGLGVEKPGDQSCAYFVFTESDGSLEMIYAGDSWSRKFVELYNGVVITGYSTSGAGENSQYVSCVGEDGKWQFVFELRTLYEDWVAGYDYETFGEDTQWSRGSTMCLLTTSDSLYYSYEADESVDQDKLAKLLKNLEDKGWKKTEDASLVAQKTMEEAGIRTERLAEFVGWSELK